jgi:ABC-type sugar transport system substrate-binding protein
LSTRGDGPRSSAIDPASWPRADRLTRRKALERFGAAGIALTALGPLLAGCGDEEGTSGAASSGGSKVDRLGFSHPFPGTDIYRPLRKGLREEAEKRGITILESQADGKADKQLAELRTWIQSGVQAISILDISGEGLAPVIEQAHAKNVKILGYGGPIEGQDGSETFDNEQGAQLVADEAMKYIQANLADADTIEVGLLTLDVLPLGKIRVHNAIEAIQAKEPRVKVVATAEGTNIAEPAQKATRSMFQAHPDIKMMICISDDGQLGAYQALKNVGKEKDVWLAGYDGSRVVMQMLLDQEMVGCTASIPLREIGRSCISIPVNVIEGKEPMNYAAPYKLVANDTPDVAKQLISDFE